MIHTSVTPVSQLTAVDRQAWTRLQRADASLDSPFMRIEFTSITGQVRDDVEVAILEQGGEVIGFFPFQRMPRRIGRPVAWPMSDLHGIVASRELECHAGQLIRDVGLVAWHFDHLLASQRAFLGHHSLVDASPYIDLRNGFDAYALDRRTVGSKTIQEARRKARKLSREVGPIRFELHTSAPHVLAALVDWKRAQLHATHGADLFEPGWVQDLLQRLLLEQTIDFSAWVSALYAGDELVAAHYGLRSHHVLASWIPTYRQDLGRYSPGLILHLALARAAAARGVTRIDLGRGMNQTKQRLMSGTTPVALGTVDSRPVPRILRHVWHNSSRLAHRSPLAKVPLRWFRYLRHRVLTH